MRGVAKRDEIIAFLDELLDAPSWEDYGPNGLQVPGADEVDTVVTGVSAHLELFERAAEAGAQMVLVHHGLFWDKQPRAIGPQLKQRLKLLFDRDISLAAYHLPLDAHAEVGNNALILQALGFERHRAFAEHRGRGIGWIGEAAEPLALADLARRCEAAFGREPLVLPGGDHPVRTLGVVSGGGASYLADAIAAGLDALVSGEPSEPAMADAREGGTHLIAGGHWATETFGIRRLGDLLEERFGVEHRFIEVKNPV